jgi:AcrR family transcriptional regulator
MRTIASALGWQPAALYYYYPSKEELLFSIMDGAVDALTRRVLEAIKEDAPATLRLRQAITAHVTSVVDHLDELSVFLQETKALGEDRQRIIQTKRDRYEGIFREILVEGMASGDLAAWDPHLAGFLVLATCNWLYNWYSPEGAYNPKELADTFCDMILQGLLKTR